MIYHFFYWLFLLLMLWIQYLSSNSTFRFTFLIKLHHVESQWFRENIEWVTPYTQSVSSVPPRLFEFLPSIYFLGLCRLYLFLSIEGRWSSIAHKWMSKTPDCLEMNPGKYTVHDSILEPYVSTFLSSGFQSLLSLCKVHCWRYVY